MDQATLGRSHIFLKNNIVQLNKTNKVHEYILILYYLHTYTIYYTPMIIIYSYLSIY